MSSNSPTNIRPAGITKALSFKQPYAWLISNGYLEVDDRTWGTDYRGPILIHASKGLYETFYDYLIDKTDIPLPPKDKLEHGGIVGVANLVLCCRPGEVPESLSAKQRAHFGGVNSDLYGFLFEEVAPLPLMPCPGKLGLFEIDIDALFNAPPPDQYELF